MKIITDNQQEVIEDIRKWHNSAEDRVNLFPTHVNPLVQKWFSYRDQIKNLFEDNSGLIKKEDFRLVSKFMVGCLKREITENGTNWLAVNETRTSILMDAVEKFQIKLL